MRYFLAVLITVLLAVSCGLEPEGLTENEITLAISQIYISKDTEVYTDIVTRKPASGIYQANFENGNPKAEITFEDGYAIDGNIRNEEGDVLISFAKEGNQYTQTRYHPNGNKAQWIVFRNGIFGIGSFKAWYEDGNPEMESTPEVIRNWYPGGQMESEIHYRNEELHGRAVKWHENGQLAGESFYIDGVLHGSYTEWDEEGNRIIEREYDNGEIVSENR